MQKRSELIIPISSKSWRLLSVSMTAPLPSNTTTPTPRGDALRETTQLYIGEDEVLFYGNDGELVYQELDYEETVAPPPKCGRRSLVCKIGLIVGVLLALIGISALVLVLFQPEPPPWSQENLALRPAKGRALDEAFANRSTSYSKTKNGHIVWKRDLFHGELPMSIRKRDSNGHVETGEPTLGLVVDKCGEGWTAKMIFERDETEVHQDTGEANSDRLMFDTCCDNINRRNGHTYGIINSTIQFRYDEDASMNNTYPTLREFQYVNLKATQESLIFEVKDLSTPSEEYPHELTGYELSKPLLLPGTRLTTKEDGTNAIEVADMHAPKQGGGTHPIWLPLEDSPKFYMKPVGKKPNGGDYIWIWTNKPKRERGKYILKHDEKRFAEKKFVWDLHKKHFVDDNLEKKYRNELVRNCILKDWRWRLKGSDWLSFTECHVPELSPKGDVQYPIRVYGVVNSISFQMLISDLHTDSAESGWFSIKTHEDVATELKALLPDVAEGDELDMKYDFKAGHKCPTLVFRKTDENRLCGVEFQSATIRPFGCSENGEGEPNRKVIDCRGDC